MNRIYFFPDVVDSRTGSKVFFTSKDDADGFAAATGKAYESLEADRDDHLEIARGGQKAWKATIVGSQVAHCARVEGLQAYRQAENREAAFKWPDGYIYVLAPSRDEARERAQKLYDMLTEVAKVVDNG
jgi:hypothetical protein